MKLYVSALVIEILVVCTIFFVLKFALRLFLLDKLFLFIMLYFIIITSISFN